MKRTLSALATGLVALSVLSAVLTAGAAPFEGESTTGYRVLSIPALPLESVGSPIRVPEGMSDDGWVTLGSQFDSEHQFWDTTGYPNRDIGCEGCTEFTIEDINDSNVMVGSYRPTSGAALRGFVWSGGVFADIGFPPDFSGNGDIEVVGIDDAGNITGNYEGAPGVCKPEDSTDGTSEWPCAFLGVPNGAGFDFTRLPPVPGDGNLELGFDVVSANDIGGGYVLSRFYRWSQTGGYEYLPESFVASHINESGQMAGTIDGQVTAAFLADPGSAPVSFALGGHLTSTATGINDAGWVVGHSGTSSERRAFLYKSGPGEIIDLGTVSGSAGDPASEAHAVSDTGLVAGVIASSVIGESMAVIWDLDRDFTINYPVEVDTSNLTATTIAGDRLEFAPSISDPEGDPYTVTWSDLPPEASWDPTTEVLTWQTTADDAGTHVATMTVSQAAEDPSVSFQVDLVVESPGLVLEPIGDKTVAAGSTLAFTIVATGDPNPSYEMFWENGTPANVSWDGATGTFGWTPTLDQAGSYNVEFVAFVEGGSGELFDSESITIDVTEPSDGPITIVIDESILVIDDPAVLPAAVIEIFESIEVSDTVIVRPPVSISIVEQVVVDDDPTVRPPISISIVEEVSVSDEPALSPSVVIRLTETIGVDDAVIVDPEALAQVGGTKWEDTDGNAIRDAGEFAIEGVTVYLDLDDDGTLDADEPSTTTGPDGSYEFTGLVPGEWVVREIVPGGYVQTFPLAEDEGEHRVTLAAGETVGDADFGNRPIDLPPVIEPIDDVFGLVGQEIVVVPTVTDPEGDVFDLTWEGGPPNAVINGIWVLTPDEDQGESVFEITVTATQVDDPSLSTSETFRVYVAALPAVQKVKPSVDPAQAEPGGEIRISGGGFLPGSEAGFYFFSDPVLLGTAVVGSDGVVDTIVTIPEDATDGPHQIVVMGVDTEGVLRVLATDFEVISDRDDDGLRDSEEALTGTDPDDSDTDGDGLIDGLDASWLIAYLDELPDDVFKRRWHRPVMKLTVRAAAIAVNLGEGDAALDILDRLDRRVDGCGTQPDPSDWIVDCSTQIEFRRLLWLYERGVQTLPLPRPKPGWRTVR